MANWCADLDSALMHSQGVQDALANIAGWLDQAENQLKNLNKPASLIRDRLDEQIRQVRMLQADIDSHEPSIQQMYRAAQDFVQSAKNVRDSKKVETKVKDASKIDLMLSVYIGCPAALLASVFFRVVHTKLGPWRAINPLPSTCSAICPPGFTSEEKLSKICLLDIEENEGDVEDSKQE